MVVEQSNAPLTTVNKFALLEAKNGDNKAGNLEVQEVQVEKICNVQEIQSPIANRRNSPKPANKSLNPKAPFFNSSRDGSNDAIHMESTSQWVNRTFVQGTNMNVVTTNQSYLEVPSQSRDTIAIGEVEKELEMNKLGCRLWCDQVEEDSE